MEIVDGKVVQRTPAEVVLSSKLREKERIESDIERKQKELTAVQAKLSAVSADILALQNVVQEGE